MAEETTEQRQAAALIAAINTRNLDQVRAVVTEHQIAHVNIKDRSGNSPLIAAVQNGNILVLQLLAGLRANLAEIDTNGDSLLHHAAKASSEGIVTWLLRQNISVSFLLLKNSQHQTAAMVDTTDVIRNAIQAAIDVRSNSPINFNSGHFKPPPNQKNQAEQKQQKADEHDQNDFVFSANPQRD